LNIRYLLFIFGLNIDNTIMKKITIVLNTPVFIPENPGFLSQNMGYLYGVTSGI